MISQHQDPAMKMCVMLQKDTENKGPESVKEVEQETPAPTFGKAAAVLKAIQRHMCSFGTDDAHLVRLLQRQGAAVQSTDMLNKAQASLLLL
jgi:hypothetical protein